MSLIDCKDIRCWIPAEWVVVVDVQRGPAEQLAIAHLAG